MSSTGSSRQRGAVALIGAGPGDPALLTVRGADLLAVADVVVLDPAAHRGFLRFCRSDVEVIESADTDPAGTAAGLVEAASAGRRVARLVTGDPFLFGPAPAEAEIFAARGLSFEVVPGVNPATAVPTYAGVPLTAGPGGHEVRVVTAGADGEVDWRAVAAGEATLVLLDFGAGLGKAAGALIEHGRPGDTAVAVTAGGTTTGQRTVVSTLDAVERDVVTAGLDADVVAVVGEAVRRRELLSWWETKPLFGWRVLVPRTKEQAAALSEQLRSYGAIPIEVPTIAVEPPRTPQAMDRAIKGLVTGRYAWVAFTSTNALRAVREKLEELGLDARALAGIRVAAVGDITAAALRGWGIEPDLVAAGEQSSEGLLANWPDYDEVLDPLDRVLLPRADIATETLAAGLQERGWEVDDVTAYRTVRAAPPPAPTREAIKTGGFDAVLFTSSSTVRNLIGIAGKPHTSTVIAVIGPQTAAAAEELGLRVDVTAPQPSVAALAAALAEHGLARRLADDPEPPGKANRAKAAKNKKAK